MKLRQQIFKGEQQRPLVFRSLWNKKKIKFVNFVKKVFEAGSRRYNLRGNGYALKIITRDDLSSSLPGEKILDFFSKVFICHQEKNFQQLGLIFGIKIFKQASFVGCNIAMLSITCKYLKAKISLFFNKDLMTDNKTSYNYRLMWQGFNPYKIFMRFPDSFLSSLGSLFCQF